MSRLFRIAVPTLPSLYSVPLGSNSPKLLCKYSSSCGGGGGKKDFKVCCVGAAGGIGQPLSLLLKLNPLISELRLQDVKDVPGVAVDLSHIETRAKVTFGEGPDSSEMMKGSDIIVVPAGKPRQPGMTRADLFNSNAQVALNVAKQMAKAAPNAIVIFITNPVNSIVPIAAEVLKKECKFNPKNVIGCCTLDSVRSATFLAEFAKVDPKTVSIPCVGGHSGPTIVPLISRATVSCKPEGDKLKEMTKRIQEAGTEVVKAKAGKGSCTLAMAYAASRFINSLMRAMSGESNICECAYVYNENFSKVSYVATPWLLGKNGLEKDCGLGKMSDYEKELFCKMLETLAKDIKEGADWAKKQLEETKC